MSDKEEHYPEIKPRGYYSDILAPGQSSNREVRPSKYANQLQVGESPPAIIENALNECKDTSNNPKGIDLNIIRLQIKLIF